MQISFWNEYQWISESRNQAINEVEADQKQNVWNRNIVTAKITVVNYFR